MTRIGITIRPWELGGLGAVREGFEREILGRFWPRPLELTVEGSILWPLKRRKGHRTEHTLNPLSVSFIVHAQIIFLESQFLQ